MFDLDGTLANTLADIAAASNSALAQLDRPTYEVDQYPAFIGHGAPWLAQKALGQAHHHLAPKMVELILEYYKQFGHELTQPYDGIAELLNMLDQNNIRKVVLSNKPDGPAKLTMQHKFTAWSFDAVMGHLPPTPLKPDPTSAIMLMSQLGIAPEHWLYLGDSSVDMQTAKAAGIFAVGATWGFNDKQSLRDGGADALIDHPSELISLLTGN